MLKPHDRISIRLDKTPECDGRTDRQTDGRTDRIPLASTALLGHVTYFLYFGTPFICPERFELETSNLACRLNNRGANDKNEELVKWDRKGVVTYFLIFWDPLNIT